MARIDFKQAAEIGYMYVQDAGVIPVVYVPDTPKQFVPGYYTAGAIHEQGQDPAANRRQLVKDTIYLKPPGPCIQRHACRMDDMRGKLHERHLDRLSKLFDVERAGKESIYTIWDRLMGPQQCQ